MKDEALAQKADHAEWDEATKARAHELFQSMHTPPEIAEICLVPMRTVNEWVKEWGGYRDAAFRARELVRIIQDACPEQFRDLMGVQTRIISMMMRTDTPTTLKVLSQALKTITEVVLSLSRVGGALAPIQEKGAMSVEVTNLSGRTDVEANNGQATIHMMDDIPPPPPTTAAEKINARLTEIQDQEGRQAVLKQFAGPAPISPLDVAREQAHGEAGAD